MKLRRHQQEFKNIVDDIINGSDIKKITMHVTPGGGKSAIPIIAGRLITAGLADKICWIVPRLTLSYQAETNFTEIGFRKLLDHNLLIRSATNDINPCRGIQGFVTTFQALAVDENQTVLSDFKAKRYILILDEFHHISAEADIAWHEAIKPLVAQSEYLVLMTGTMSRGDGERVAFVEYDQQGKNLYPRMESDETTAFIEYTRRAALSEKAIIPLSFHLSSGSARWVNKEGALCKSDIARAPKKIVSQAIFTAISTEFAEALLWKGINHWQELKKRNKGAQLLVVTANYEEAKKIAKSLKDKWFNSEIATSHESKQAHQAIKRFKNGSIDILVAINMVSEGMDVPAVTHVICLTNIRSTEWIEQMIARAVRVDSSAGQYESQIAYVFAPDDVFFREIVSKIEHEQRPFVKARQKIQMGLFDGAENESGEPVFQIQPLSSNLAGDREIFLGNKDIATDRVIPQTPSEVEAAIRDQIENHVRQFSFINRYNPKRLNSEIKAFFEKPRDIMTVPELTVTLKHVKKAYPLGGGQALPQHGNYAKARGGGTRVPTKAVVWQE
jgi:superfamily II DNA or RNA helicase